MEKIGADLEDVAMEFSALLISDLVCLVLVYNENVVIMNVIELTADKEVFVSGKAEKHLTAIVNMYIGIGIALL